MKLQTSQGLKYQMDHIHANRSIGGFSQAMSPMLISAVPGSCWESCLYAKLLLAALVPSFTANLSRTTGTEPNWALA